MQFSSKCRETADACRFCWMCRHICPIGNVTGQERNTARARALSLSVVMRGAAELDKDIADNVYECALCGACTEDCATGWDPVIFARESRREIVLAGRTPAYIMPMLERFGESGSIYGAEEENDAFAAAAARHAAKTDILLYIGEDARHGAKKNAVKAIELLEKAGVDFTVLCDEPVSGRTLYFLCGDVKEARDAMEAAANTYGEYKKVVFYDAGDAKTAMQEAKELGIDCAAALVSFPAYIAELIDTKALKVNKGDKKYTFQDPAALTRGIEDTVSPRKVLSACGELCDMLLIGKATVLAGQKIMAEYMPETVKGMAAKRWVDCKNMGGSVMVTADSAEYLALEATKPDGCELLTIEEAVLQCL
ncbi:MAG: (Fe-S)-binding protein [Clostridia bacterium]|nr:(Fe-S)-binding protein [Clostridia bacterium]